MLYPIEIETRINEVNKLRQDALIAAARCDSDYASKVTLFKQQVKSLPKEVRDNMLLQFKSQMKRYGY